VDCACMRKLWWCSSVSFHLSRLIQKGGFGGAMLYGKTNEKARQLAS
jgi:hypothetical protein